MFADTRARTASDAHVRMNHNVARQRREQMRHLDDTISLQCAKSVTRQCYQISSCKNHTIKLDVLSAHLAPLSKHKVEPSERMGHPMGKRKHVLLHGQTRYANKQWATISYLFTSWPAMVAGSKVRENTHISPWEITRSLWDSFCTAHRIASRDKLGHTKTTKWLLTWMRHWTWHLVPNWCSLRCSNDYHDVCCQRIGRLFQDGVTNTLRFFCDCSRHIGACRTPSGKLQSNWPLLASLTADVPSWWHKSRN